MALKNVSAASALLAVALVGVLASGGFENWKMMTSKADAQAQAVEEFQTWKRQYTSLLPVEEKWLKQLHSLDEVRDLYSVYTLLGNTPRTNPDLLRIERSERLVHDGVDLKAQRVCLSSVGANGVAFEERSFESLTKGLHTLAARPDIQMGAVVFNYENGRARAQVGQLCLLLRDSEVNK